MKNVIVVLDRGWVVTGTIEKQDEHETTLINASVIRRWGTTKGLGELRKGFLPTTILEPCGTVRYNATAQVFLIEME